MKYIPLIFCLFLLALPGWSQTSNDGGNWVAQSPQVQLDSEGYDDIKGLGRIFVPMMTNSDFEPVYIVTLKDSVIKVQKMGRSVFLRPGTYTITYGSGTLAQMMKQEINIKAEETRILTPTWSGLTVRVMDETRESLKEPYEIYRMPDGEAYGIGYGADEQLGEKLQTWILPPGLYKIIKLGENFNTFINFTTVKLLPGELTQYTIVMDSETKNYLGSGILEFEARQKRIKNWYIYSALYGSFTLNRANDVTSDEQQTTMAFVAQLDYNIRYSTHRHYFLARGLVEEGWNMQRKQNTFRSYLDNVRLKNLYIYYFFPYLGFYGRLFLETNLFQTAYYYDSPQTITLYDAHGNLERTKTVRSFSAAPSFSPLELKEGIGINLQLLKSLRANLNIRAGMGFRQNINWNLYTQDSQDNLSYYAKNSAWLRGPEASLIGNYRVFRNMMITSELDMLLPYGTNDQFVYDWENNINLRLSKNISIDYTLRIKHDPSIVSYTQSEQILLFRYSYILF
ncbi:hypothetical protein JW960_27350 [candidate division KSB1 bacterium]|nr:hypothetical protein [candidate division KSB1 bacterium]